MKVLKIIAAAWLLATGVVDQSGAAGSSRDAMPAVSVNRDEAGSRGKAVPTVSTGHANSITAMVLSNNGRWLATAAPGSIKLWDSASGRMLRTLSMPENKTISGLAVSPDDRRLVVVTNGRFIVWNPETGEQIRTFPITDESSIFFSSERQVTSMDHGKILTWDIEKGVLLRTTGKELPSLREFGWVMSWAISPDQKILALGFHHSDNWIARVQLIEIATWRVLQTMDSHTDDVNSVSFSSDGRLLASASVDKTTRVWDVATGAPVARMNGQVTHVLRVRFSNDNKLVLSSGSEENLYVWNAATGDLINRVKAGGYISTFAFPKENDLVAVSVHDHVEFRKLPSGEKIRATRSQSIGDVRVMPGPGDKWFADVHFVLRAWDAATGQLIRHVSDHYFGYPASKPNADGRWLHVDGVGGADKALNLWDGATEQKIATIPLNIGTPHYSLLAVSVDAGLAVYSVQQPDSKQTTYRILDTRTRKQLREFRLENDELFFPQFSPDGKQLIAIRSAPKKDGSYSGFSELRAWNVSDDRGSKTLFRGKFLPNNATYSPDGKYIVIWGDSTVMLDAGTGRQRWALSSDTDYVSQVTFSPDSRTVVTNSFGVELQVRDIATGRVVRTLRGNPGYAQSLGFVQGGRKLIVANDNNTYSIWDAGKGELLATTVQSGSGEWVTITPEGFYTVSEHGAELIYVVRGYDIVEAGQVYQALYRPDLVREKLAGDPRGRVREAAASIDLDRVIASGNAPDVQLSLPGRAVGPVVVDGDNISADAEITDRGGGIGRIEWRINGVTAGVDQAPAAQAGQPVRVTRNLALDIGANAIEVVAYNSANLVASVPTRISVTTQVAAPPASPQVTAPSAPAALAKPRLVALVAGINDYAEKRIKLRYSVPDANEIARGLKEASGDLYESVEIRLLTDAKVTRRGLDAAFTEIGSKTKVSDVFVLYLAGHGKTVDGRYYFIPQDLLIDGEMTDQRIDAAVRAKAIPQDQWQRWFASVPARKSLILFDTCDSGTLTGDAAETQKLEKGAANDRLAQATGRSIITASGGSQQAIEGYNGHGLFTYEVLDALNRADINGSGTVELTELAAFVYAQVSYLSLSVFQQSQAPQMKITSNYSLVKQTRVLQDEVAPIAEIAPTHELMASALLQIEPAAGGTVVRSLSAKTAVTVLESKNGWSLIAREGRPIGYVATRDLARVK